MRLYLYPLFLFTFLSLARAAKLPALDARDLEKKLAAVAQEAAKDIVPVDNASNNEDLTDQTTVINEIENNLRIKTNDIPVKVVVENAKSTVEGIENINTNEEQNTEESSDIKRVEIDLKNPGLPQRQEHDTQNPEHYEEPVPKLKESIVNTQAALKQGFQGVADWIANNEQINSIQSSLQNLQESFTSQIQKLNDTVQSIWNNDPNKNEAGSEPGQTKAINNVEIGLKTLEDSFRSGIKALTEEVHASNIVRADGDKPGESGATTDGSASGGSGSDGASNNPFLQALQSFQNTVSQSLSNVTSAWQNYITSIQQGNAGNNTSSGPGSFISGIGSGIQNIFAQSPSTPATGQSDEVSGTTSRPGLPIWQGIQSSIQNIWNLGQNQPTQSPQNDQPAQSSSGPIAQAIQNNPLVQGVVNLIQPNRPGAQQPQAVKPADPSQQEGSNVVPAPTESKPEQSTAEKIQPSADGPIKKIIQNNPIVKGISGAVHKLTSPERPRDTVEGQKSDKDVKGGLFIGGHGVHGGHGGHGGSHSEYNNNSRGLENNEQSNIEETQRIQNEKDVLDKEESKPEVQPDKTE
ncbi:putative uncharacterized protein DDB_G0286901 isoform X2 [Galleria mellonella]|uniref:Uncharacterized protein n=1 Tax=Galleria mellonella TaxID=7137 RepID=A0A6J3C4W0_GALME|nr:putative uncharacterized protein DDB_G0286901 isoform X2 [Galleria mellonella]